MMTHALNLKLDPGCRLVEIFSNFVLVDYKNLFQVKFPVHSKKDINSVLSLIGPGMVIEIKQLTEKNGILETLFSHGLVSVQLLRDNKPILTTKILIPLNLQEKVSYTDEVFWSAFVTFVPNTQNMLLKGTEAFSVIELEKEFALELINLSYKKSLHCLDFQDPLIFQVLRSLNFLTAQKEDPLSKYWEQHDREFMSQTRMRSVFDLRENGAVYPFSHPAPIPKKITGRSEILLPNNPSLPIPELFQKRKSNRIGDSRTQLTFKDLADFLQLITHNVKDKNDTVHKVYPVAGNIESPEFLIINNSCIGLGTGIYYYDVSENRLIVVEDDVSVVKNQMQVYSNFWFRENGVPQVVIQVIRNFPSMAWKYRGINLKVLLVEAGCVLESAQLLAADLGLSCCPIGMGPMNLISDSLLSNRLDWGRIPLMEFTLEK